MTTTSTDSNGVVALATTAPKVGAVLAAKIRTTNSSSEDTTPVPQAVESTTSLKTGNTLGVVQEEGRKLTINLAWAIPPVLLFIGFLIIKRIRSARA